MLHSSMVDSMKAEVHLCGDFQLQIGTRTRPGYYCNQSFHTKKEILYKEKVSSILHQYEVMTSTNTAVVAMLVTAGGDGGSRGVPIFS